MKTTEAAALTELELRTWRGFLGAHAAIARELDANLVAQHGLTLKAYEVLLHLNECDGSRLRMSRLAEGVGLTRSGLTRLVDGLERDGLVRRATCGQDGRGAFTEMTPDGRSKLLEAATTHVAGVRELFAERFTGEELELLDAMLGRLPRPVCAGSCAAGPAGASGPGRK